MSKSAFGEVTESAITEFQITCWPERERIKLGTLVVSQSEPYPIVGIVYNITTTPDDSVRRPFAFQMSRQELKEQHPEVFAFTFTRLACATIGYLKEGRFQQVLPPLPAELHDHVEVAPTGILHAFFSSPNFVQALFHQQALQPLLDEFLLSLLVAMHHEGLLEPILDQIIEQYSLLIGNDYRRLKLFVGRLQTQLR